MQRKLGMVFVVIAGLLTGPALFSGEGTEKTVVVKVKLPPGETVKLSIDGKEYKDTGDSREVTVKTKKDTITVSAFWEPNNYTKITRKWKVKAQEEVNLDMTKADAKQRDDVVVRYVPTPDDVVDAMCKMAKVTKNDVVFDLGCGDGRLVNRAVKFHNAKRGVGIDLDPELVKESKENAKKMGVDDKVEFRIGDVLKIKDLSDADVVLLYMGEDINKLLKPILQKTLKPGARVVSHRFTMGDDWKPERTESVNSTAMYECLIHLWTIKKRD